MSIREQIIEVADTLLGTPYSRLDCNELVRAVFRKFGLEMGDPSSENARDLYNKGVAKLIDKSKKVADIIPLLNKGDVVAWSNNSSGRWKGIHHISIYDEDGYNYESSSSRGEVVRRKLWESSSQDSWQIVLIADVTSLLKYESGEEKVMKKGDSGETVYMLQRAMLAAGYTMLKAGKSWADLQTGEINGCDGKFGDWTELVVTEIQEKHGLNKTGVVDYLTYGFIASDIEPENEDYVKQLEEKIQDVEALRNDDKLAFTDIAEKAASRIGKKLA